MSPELCRMEDSAVISCYPDLTVTIRKKMNSFKKFKRRMGLGKCSLCRHGCFLRTMTKKSFRPADINGVSVEAVIPGHALALQFFRYSSKHN